MNDILARVRQLPSPLVDGRWTHCAVSVAGGRIRFSEPAPLAQVRRRSALRKRGLWSGVALGCLAAAARLRGGLGGLAALAGSVAGLAALDGLGRDLRPADRPHEYAVIDAIRGEVDLRAPGGWTITAPLGDIRMFLMVIDASSQRCHLGVVLADGNYLPWLTTALPQPANALCWVFGHLTGRPAMRVLGALPLAPDWAEQVEPIEPPTL